ncbi:cell envelope integrity protein TolA [Devosia chinhatensis]|uniref:TonB C-terminal domain-containing protein n=1 Tax=Devosia chinhatensis TaxID=429727 RepID=A0A0F5FNW3_9HYPH|nr:TonB family protein [Devosia chinhatensis]KKB09897.1 hypothetical protein VE26_08720 [Devosia chinhatensis]
MRLALPGSALAHAGCVALLGLGFVWPQADDAAAPAPVTVNIIPLSNVASNATQVLSADNTISSLSAGGPETISEMPPAVLEPVIREAEPVRAEIIEAVTADPAETVQLSTTAESPDAIQPLTPARVTRQQVIDVASLALASLAENLAPIETQTLVTPPAMPTPVSQRPPDRPRPAPEEARPRPIAPQREGNGGDGQADSIASAGGTPPQQANTGTGGQAEIARYPSQVIGKLRNAMRRGGDRGEMIVRFTVGASGDLQAVSVARSSGNPVVDAAGTALVQRAAPFPPIPAAAARNSWTFDVPLAFGG